MMHHIKNISLLALLVGTTLLAGCEKTGNGDVLARVDGSAITRQQLDAMAVTTLGYDKALQLDQAGRKKILESLVISRAMAHAMATELTDKEQKDIERDMTAYREQLLVKRYLRRHALPEAITQQRIQDYYNKHLERFGGKTVRQYELLLGTEKLDGGSRKQLMKVLAKAGKNKNWKRLSSNLRNKGYAVQYRKGQAEQSVLHPRLYSLITTTKIKATSDLTFIENKPYLVRVLSETKQTARPLKDVSGKVRKVLTLLQLKEATREASQEILKKTDVEYIN
jgi:Ni/Co efflux regulator RcnB